MLSAMIDHMPITRARCDRLVLTAQLVLRATVKGSLVVAVVQGALGGLIFAGLGIRGAVLWAVVMAFMALLPPFGSAVIWAPVALFLLLTGEVWRAAILVTLGLFLVGLIDNLLRPLLVGHETRLPEGLVLLSTLGGLALLGLDGIVLGPLIAALCLASWAEVRLPAPGPSRIRDVT